MVNAYTTVDAVLIATCLKIGDKNLSKYAVLNAHATSWFMADYNPESGQTVRTILLDVGPDRVAELPEDYLDFVMIGRQVGALVRNLAHNPRLSPLPPVEPWLDRVPFDALAGQDWPCYQYAGWDGAALCGYGWGEYREEFTIDEQQRVLRLSSVVGTDQPLFFQYISADLTPHKATPLHPAYALALEYWCLWQWHLRKNESGVAANYERLYGKARDKARSQLSPFCYATLQAIISSSYNTVR